MVFLRDGDLAEDPSFLRRLQLLVGSVLLGCRRSSPVARLQRNPAGHSKLVLDVSALPRRVVLISVDREAVLPACRRVRARPLEGRFLGATSGLHEHCVGCIPERFQRTPSSRGPRRPLRGLATTAGRSGWKMLPEVGRAFLRLWGAGRGTSARTAGRLTQMAMCALPRRGLVDHLRCDGCRLSG